MATRRLEVVISGDASGATKAFAEVEDAGGGMTSKLGDFASQAAAVFSGEALMGAVSGLGAKLSGAFADAMDLEVANDKLAAQLGLMPAGAERYGRLAGELFAGAYGENIGDVNEALRHVTLNLGTFVGDSDEALKGATATALDFAAAFGEEVGPTTRAVGQILRTGLAKDATEAFDILTIGMQNGANSAEDLLDTFDEYSTMFRGMGIDGKMALGLITQAVHAGARDADTAADALKEFAIRSKDASDSSAEGFRALGLDAAKMTAQFAKGGPASAAGLDLVLDRLRAMKDPVKQNAAAVALFGTKAEDLDKALFAMDPTTAVESLGEVAGAAQHMGETLADNAATKLESFKRTMQQGLVGFMKDTVLPGVVSVAEQVGAALGPVADTARETWGTFVSALKGEGEAPDWMKPIVEAIFKIRDAFDEFRPKLESFVKDVLQKVIDAWPTIRDGLLTFYNEALVPFFTFIGDHADMLKNLAVIFGIIAAIVVGSIVVAFVALIAAIGVVVAAGVALVIGFQMLIQVLWDVFNNVRDALGGVIDWFENVIQIGWDLVRNIGSAIADTVRIVWGLATGAANMAMSVGNKLREVVGWFIGLPGQILGALGDLGSLLWNSGANLLIGLWNGIVSKLQWLKDKVAGALGSIRNLFPFSPAKEGPFSGRGWVSYSGEAIAEGFAEGMLGGASDVHAAASQVAGAAHDPYTSMPAGGAAAGGITVNVNGYVGNEDELGRVIARHLEAAARRGLRSPVLVSA